MPARPPGRLRPLSTATSGLCVGQKVHGHWSSHYRPERDASHSSGVGARGGLWLLVRRTYPRARRPERPTPCLSYVRGRSRLLSGEMERCDPPYPRISTSSRRREHSLFTEVSATKVVERERRRCSAPALRSRDDPIDSALSSVFRVTIAGGPSGRNLERIAPVLGVLTIAFGTWYALGALGVLTYPL